MSGFRCKACGHKPRRVVSETSKRKGSIPAAARQHKKTCDCGCHRAAILAASPRTVEAATVPADSTPQAVSGNNIDVRTVDISVAADRHRTRQAS